MMTQESTAYIETFRSLSTVTWIFCILPCLNILCKSSEKPY